MAPYMEKHFADVFSVKDLKMGRLSWFAIIGPGRSQSVWEVMVVNKWEELPEKPDNHFRMGSTSGSGNTSPPSSAIPSLIWG